MNNQDILVSVIMCVYNTPKEYLFEAVQSILKQSYKHFELIIVDDHSDTTYFDDPLFDDRRIIIIQNKQNLGPAASRNVAIKKSSGKYIAIMDSDDISLPNRLEKQVAFMEDNPDVVVCGTWYRHIGAKDNFVKIDFDDNELYRCNLLFGNSPTLLNPSALIRKETLINNGIMYDESLRMGEDYKMWVQLATIGKITNLKEVHVLYRVHSSQSTFKNNKRHQSSVYDRKVKLMQLNSISTEFTEDEKNIFVSDVTDRSIKPFSYYLLLNKIVSLNSKSNFFSQSHLQKRINEQWNSKIYNSSIFQVIALLHKLPKNEKKRIRKLETDRLKRHLFRK